MRLLLLDVVIFSCLCLYHLSYLPLALVQHQPTSPRSDLYLGELVLFQDMRPFELSHICSDVREMGFDVLELPVNNNEPEVCCDVYVCVCACVSCVCCI